MEQIVEEGYDRIVRVYQGHRKTFDNWRELEECGALLPKMPRVLDAGCGTGIPVARWLVARGYEVTGIDLSEKMLRLARKNVPTAYFLKMDMTNLDFEADSFDGLVAMYSVIHVPRRIHARLFKEFHRILHPNGVMLVSLGSSGWQGTGDFHGVKMFWSHFGPKQSERLIKLAGFRILSGRYVESGGERHYWVLARKNEQ